jgi:hypothetical protein
MRHHFRHPQAMFNKGSLFYSHCGPALLAKLSNVSCTWLNIYQNKQLYTFFQSSKQLYSCQSFKNTLTTKTILINNFVILLFSRRRVKEHCFHEWGRKKITSGEGHNWFLESPQVKIMFLLS